MPGNGKVKSVAGAGAFAAKEKRRGKKIVTTNGCFDVLHVGHLWSLEQAKRLGDVLIVGVNSDASVRRLKGPGRPIVPQRERAELIAGLWPVDVVFIFSDPTPNRWLTMIKPHIHVKGADRTLAEMPERETVERNGGKIVRAKLRKGKSTTNIIKRIKEGN
jgi:rfaE bifunctional protein nucleotidyltransferase chain/domain